jgi:hypothetical protein
MFLGFLVISGLTFLALLVVAGFVTEYLKSQARSGLRAENVAQLTDLKRQMIDRGMSAEDIERVIRALPPQLQEETTSTSLNETSSADPEVLLSTKMVEHDVPPQAMEAILSAFRSAEPAVRLKAAMAVVSILENTENPDDNDYFERIVVAARSLCQAPTSGERRQDDRIVREVVPLQRGAL